MDLRALSDRLKTQTGRWVLDQGRRLVPRFGYTLQRQALYWPLNPADQSYTRPVTALSEGNVAFAGFPVPPPRLWADYCTTAESWVASGEADGRTMRDLVAAAGAPIGGCRRILEIGCATGRILRSLADVAAGAEVWGIDVWSDAVEWCQQNLAPPFHFATTTSAPHVPFEERSFDLVYGGSVFTHIAELTEAWMLELHRVLRPGGHLYISLNDRAAAAIFEGEATAEEMEGFVERVGGREAWDNWVATLHADPGYARFLSGEASMLVLGRTTMPHVLWDADVLCDRVAWGFRRRSLTRAGYGHQSTLLLERI
ncbi:MAG TPA: methyltransferase domain-containing protein [Acidimicrobiales bacterium]|nr:methyltransferase domain-containing protein [Acidimicrobiales bacterium]